MTPRTLFRHFFTVIEYFSPSDRCFARSYPLPLPNSVFWTPETVGLTVNGARLSRNSTASHKNLRVALHQDDVRQHAPQDPEIFDLGPRARLHPAGRAASVHEPARDPFPAQHAAAAAATRGGACVAPADHRAESNLLRPRRGQLPAIGARSRVPAVLKPARPSDNTEDQHRVGAGRRHTYRRPDHCRPRAFKLGEGRARGRQSAAVHPTDTAGGPVHAGHAHPPGADGRHASAPCRHRRRHHPAHLVGGAAYDRARVAADPLRGERRQRISDKGAVFFDVQRPAPGHAPPGEPRSSPSSRRRSTGRTPWRPTVGCP